MADLFVVNDPWGVSVRLTERKWAHLVQKHNEIAPYLDLVRETIEHPNLVYEAQTAPDSKAFYSRSRVVPDRRFRGCRVAVIVRYTTLPASIPSVYLPYRITGNLGNLIYTEHGT